MPETVAVCLHREHGADRAGLLVAGGRLAARGDKRVGVTRRRGPSFDAERSADNIRSRQDAGG